MYVYLYTTETVYVYTTETQLYVYVYTTETLKSVERKQKGILSYILMDPSKYKFLNKNFSTAFIYLFIYIYLLSDSLGQALWLKRLHFPWVLCKTHKIRGTGEQVQEAGIHASLLSFSIRSLEQNSPTVFSTILSIE